MGRALITIICGFPLALVLLHTVVRVIRYFHKFPIPEFLANAIDNPFRRKIQPPAETALRHGIQPGMRVLEVGPGNGTYTVEAARAVGETGKLVTVDIEEKMIQRVARKITGEGITNIEARVANVYDLPYEDQFFYLIYMITVINEISDQEKAFSEFFRVLSPAGTLVFSELLLDPDYPLVGTLVRRAEKAGFRLKERKGNFFYYTLIFEKDI